MPQTKTLLLACLLIPFCANAMLHVPVGDGPNLATVVVQFSSGDTFVFDTAFQPATLTGLELMDIIEAETALTTYRLDFGFGAFIDGMTYGPHSDIGFGGGEDWWHYWTRADNGSPWVSSMIGAGDRVVSDGAWDGWVYGSAMPPNYIPEPSSLLLSLFGVLCLRHLACRT